MIRLLNWLFARKSRYRIDGYKIYGDGDEFEIKRNIARGIRARIAKGQ